MKILVALMILSLAGCASHRAELTQTAPSRLVNQSRQAILACMGKPARQENQGHAESLVFAASVDEPVCPMKKLAGVAPPSLQCEAVFTLQAGKVQTVKLQAVAGRSKKPEDDCAFLLAKCLQQ